MSVSVSLLLWMLAGALRCETDRYIAWPGQALAYKLGERKIKELRALIKASLGTAFDIRAFHDQLPGSGPLRLELLDAGTRDWIASRKPADRGTDRLSLSVAFANAYWP